MLFSFNKLKKLANLSNKISLDKVVNAINSLGFEVEKTINLNTYKKIKFGKVISVEKNVNAQNLVVAKIAFEDKERIIQTNFQDLEVDKIVLAFVANSQLNDFTFSDKKMQGIVSEGMLISWETLGIKEEFLREQDQNKIIYFSSISNLKTDPIKYLELNDVMIEVNILSNRADANAYLIMAQELAAFFKTNFITLAKKSANISTNIQINSKSHNRLVVIESINNFHLDVSDLLFIAKHNIQLVNDAIDLTNLTFLFSGQPLNVFPLPNQKNNFKIDYIVDANMELDNQKILLDDNLILSNNNDILSLVGLPPFQQLPNDYQKNIVFVLGQYDVKEVRKNMKKIKFNYLQLNQSAKKLNWGTLNLAIIFLSSILKNFSQPLNSNVIQKEQKIKYDVKTDLYQVLGFDITKKKKWVQTKLALEKLGFKFFKKYIKIPNYRYDISNVQDINEEILRFFGYDNIPLIQPEIVAIKTNSNVCLKDKIVALGYQEVNTYTLTSSKGNFFNPFNFRGEIKLKTFISQEHAIIRNSQVKPLFDIVKYHQKSKFEDLSFFSYGMINNGFFTFAFVSTCKNFSQMQNDAIALLPPGITFKRMSEKSFHPNVNAEIIYNSQKIGWIGKISPILLSEDMIFMEFFYPYSKNNSNPSFNVQKYESKPLKTRDITFILDLKEDINFAKDVDVFFIKLIDSYIRKNKKHLTFRFFGNDVQIDLLDKKYNKN